MRLICFFLTTLIAGITINQSVWAATISGELKKWHRITLLFDGINTAEQAATNPFYDYRLNVTFTKGAKVYVVPGHYAADGNAAETSDSTGSKWRVYFSPDETGIWNYSVSFRTAAGIAIDDNINAGTPVAPLDGETGSFTITATDKTGKDFRGKGRLEYVGEHYLQFAETGEYFLKGGADSPENFLAYHEFDQTKDLGGTSTPGLVVGLHQYANHIQHWNNGPTWQGGKGKGIIGAINYLSSHDVNSIYFLTYNVDGGDGRDTWVWTDENERYRFDVSKLDQWEIVFSHMDQSGIQLHMVTQETENDNSLGGSGTLNNIRKLYYRELVSRFGHHLAVQWNLGEENTNTDFNRAAFAEYIKNADPYDHPINIHTQWNNALTFYDGLLSNASYLQYFDATSLQGSAGNYNNWAIQLRDDSKAAGRKWVIYGDEQGPAVDPAGGNDALRRDALWGNLMGGGGGVEWYFGYQNTFGDVQSEDFTLVETLWDQTSYAINFFQEFVPFQEMEAANNLLTAGNGDLCFAKPGEYYVIYLRYGGGGGIDLNISDPGNYTVKWFNPRTGGALQDGSTTSVTGNGVADLGNNPANDNNDWVGLIINDTINITPPAITSNYWTGAVDDEWFNVSNWLYPTLPDSSVDVIIPDVSPNDFPVIPGGAGLVASAKDIQINNGGSLSISALNNATLRIFGDLTVNGTLQSDGKINFNGNSQLNMLTTFSGEVNVLNGATLTTNGNLLLESNASLMHGTGTPGGGGTINGSIIINRIGHSDSLKYNFWSSPVENENVNILGNNLYYFDPGNATDTSQQGMENGWITASGLMVRGKGYISQGSGTVAFSGVPNNANTGSPIQTAVEKNAGTINNVPYNLVGNPFPSALDAAAFTSVNNGVIGGAIYLWDDDGTGGSGFSTTEDYVTWNSLGTVSVTGANSGIVFDGHIASGQSFFVEKLSDGIDYVEFRNSMRTTENEIFFRQMPKERLWISVTNQVGHYNETLIGFLPDATEGKDQKYDARKFKGNANISLYSKLNGRNYAIQGLPLLTDDRTVALGLDAGIAGQHTLSLKNLEQLDETVVVWLEDKLLGVFQNLRSDPEYSFMQTAGKDIDRFILHFNPPMEISTTEIDCDGTGGEITLVQNGITKWNYILTNENGDLIESQTDFNGWDQITGLSSGVYELKISDTSGYQINKTIEVTAQIPVEASFDVSHQVASINDSVSFINLSSGATQYAWDLGDGTVLYEENPVHTYQQEGVYEVTLFASNNSCENEYSVIVDVQNNLTGLNAAVEGHIQIYGWGTKVFVQFHDEVPKNAKLEIYDIFGRRLFNDKLSNKIIQEIQLHPPTFGYYIVKVTTENNIHVRKILLTE